jgi:hypothetical protein
MTEGMTGDIWMTEAGPQGEILLYQTEDGLARVGCRFVEGSIWLTQRLIGELFQKDVWTINEHLQNIYAEGELGPEATIRKFRIVQTEGVRQVARLVEHYNLEAILAVGYRVRSGRGTAFRQWATARLAEYLVKGFVMDDERLKNPPGRGVPDYFDEMLERIRDIRSSERRMYLQVRNILALAEYFNNYDCRGNGPSILENILVNVFIFCIASSVSFVWQVKSGSSAWPGSSSKGRGSIRMPLCCRIPALRTTT